MKDRKAGLRLLGRFFAIVSVALAMTGCASVYVDGAIKEVPAAQFAKPVNPAPLQMFFEFQTKGVANAKATDLLKERVTTQVRESGLFSQVSDAPSANAGILSVTLNNVPMSDDAFSKGFVTGLTFGLAGSQVSDGYICTAKFTPADGSAPVVKSARHALHTTLGATAAPGNAVKASSPTEGVYLMTRQVLSQVLSELAGDRGFSH